MPPFAKILQHAFPKNNDLQNHNVIITPKNLKCSDNTYSTVHIQIFLTVPKYQFVVVFLIF